MILDKLLKTTDHASRVIAHPLYQIFPHRLVLKYFNEINTNHIPHHDFKVTVRNDMEKNGLLNPIIINDKNEIMSGNHRFHILTKAKIAGSLFYKTYNDSEAVFLTKVGQKVWNMHLTNKKVPDWSFLFEDDLIKYTEKNMKILQEGVSENTIVRT